MKIVVQRLAEQDLREASAWYDSKAPNFGKDFLKEAKLTLEKLVQFPTAHSFYYKNLRRVMINRFPYKMFYHIEDNNVVVARVLHAKRNHITFLK